MSVKLDVGGESIELEKGLVQVASIYEKCGINPLEKRLYLDKSGDIDIPLLPDDYIVIHGDEVITSDDISADIGDNPAVRNEICFVLNGKKIESGLKCAKIDSKEICAMDKELATAKLFVDVSGAVDDFVKIGITLVIQEADCYFTIPSSDEDLVDIEECSKSGHKPPKGQKAYRIRIDKKKYRVEQQQMTGNEILELADKSSKGWTLNQKLQGGRRVLIEAEAKVDFSKPGVERFETVPKQAQQG